jgi:hypothetical protein
MTTFDDGDATISGVYPSVLEALRDVYGRIEGEEWPELLKCPRCEDKQSIRVTTPSHPYGLDIACPVCSR